MSEKSEEPSKQPSVDISKLADVALPRIPKTPTRLADLARGFAGNSNKELNDLAAGLAGSSKLREMTEGLKANSLLSDYVKGLTGAPEILKQMDAERERIAALTRPSPLLQSVMGQIENQKKLIGDISTKLPYHEPRSVARMPKLPPNPVLETNKRLKQVEERLDKMITVIANAAEIANGIQAYAADFLTKFEKASKDTDKSARRAVWIGIIAIGIAVATPFIQSAVDFGKEQVYPDPTAPAIQALQDEVARLKATEAANTEKIIAELVNGDPADAEKIASALREGDAETVKLLREITKLLAEQAKRLPSPPTK